MGTRFVHNHQKDENINFGVNRLERLVLLLDTGSSASVRSAAAKQLGEIQKQHPNDLYPLLERVIFHLNSKSWDSRVAAGQAIEAICDNVPQWDPPHGTSTDDSIDSLKGLLSFSSLNVEMVLEKGMPLLASAGKEFDAENLDLANLPPKERLQIQKKRLIEKLGLGTQFMDVDFFDENDVNLDRGEALAPNNKKDARDVVESTIQVKEGKEDPFAGLSARERNQLKRKMKLASKNQGKDGTSFTTDISSSSALKKRKIEENDIPADPNTTVVSFKPKPEVSSLSVFSSGDEWPFEGLVEKLSFDLFSHRWETRHGAAIGLREVLKVHGKGYGKVVGLKKKENEERNQQMLEDLAVRLICVLCLDRFVDFVGDQAVIPVRETCAQALAVVLEHCSPTLCLDVMQKALLVMVHYQSLVSGSQKSGNGGVEQKWAVRHAALIGIKYWMAVRQDLLDRILVHDSPAFLAIVEGLKDHNDDVRAVSSSALLPITDLLVKLIPEKNIFDSVVICLWDSLQELDDLTAATSSVMDLLSDLLRKPPIAAVLQKEASKFLEKLVPQLYPFFRHAIASVRLAVLRTLSTLAVLASENRTSGMIGWITTDLLRLLFQNFVLEERKDVVGLSLSLWSQLVDLLDRVDSSVIDEILKPHMSIILALGVCPIGKPLDHRLFISYQKEGSSKKTRGIDALNIPPQDRAIMNQELTVVSFNTILHGRIAGATALGRLICNLSFFAGSPPLITEWIMTYINSGWGIHRILTGIIIQEWAEYYSVKSAILGQSVPLLDSHPGWKTIWDTLMSVLHDINAGATLYFVELQDSLTTLWNECTFIYNALLRMGRQPPAIPPISATEESIALNSPLGAQFTLESADLFLDQFCPGVMNGVSDSLLELYGKALSTKSTLSSIKKTLDPRVYSSLAAAVVYMGNLPIKLNPLIRNLMNSIQCEENSELQVRSAKGIARMLYINVSLSVRGTVNDKIVKNLCAFLCSDPSTVGILAEQASHSGTITFAKLKAMKNYLSKKGGKKKSISVNVDLDGAANDAIQDAATALANEQELVGKKILHAGAEASLKALCSLFGESLFTSVPALYEIATKSLLTASPLLIQSNGALAPDNEISQPLVDNLHVLEILARYVNTSLYPQLLELIDYIKDCLTCHLSIVRHLASASIASMAKYIKVPAMIKVVELVLPLANHATIDYDRQGSIETNYFIINNLQEEVLPYLIFLMAPILSRMSDSNEDVRFLATNAFAQLVKLAPLEAGTPNPPGFTKELIERKNIERKFIGQLIGTEKVQEFELPVAINAELRAYQKEGVSWLAFLNRYGLHGILCDDMGLGKTLQCICIISADSYNRAQEFKKIKSADFAHCPSLIVCPSPLTGHWYFEIKKYADFMKPIIYNGDKSERAAIRKKMMSFDVIIISYEVLRNDIEHLSKYLFNYCCLDEGHVIKNPSTKLTKSVKMVRSFHRLILSGTPVQNNVMDLWSLFDFLMPGFLGTEAQFNEKFGKPIFASRDAKASSREQERGALALDALHKQVLPFLMRRMKEDVLEDLPPKIIQDYYCELSDIQKMLYEDFSQISDTDGGEGASGQEEQKKGQHVFQALQYLRKLCNHPSFVLTTSHPQYDKVQAKLKAEKRNINDIENAPKLTALQQLLLDCGIGGEKNELSGVTAPHRVLIFAQVKEMLDVIQNELFKKHMPTVSYMRLDGQITDPMKRHELIQTFNQDSSIDVLLLTTHVGGLGLNLTGADTVIFMEHDWNPMKDLQAMDRAHRIGQKRVVNVYRLITKGTLEEKIMGLQKFKMNISSAIINSENAGIASMGTDQIIDLFSVDSGDGNGEDKNAASQSAGKIGAKDAIANLGQLWNEAEYEDLQVDDFLKNIQSRRK